MASHSVLLDPYVALGLVEHFMRNPPSVNEDSEIIENRIEGFLLGGHVKNVTQIRGFVPSLTDELMRLTMRCSPRDLAVGWYTNELDSEKDKTIQERIDRNVDRPVFLFVQVPSEETPELKFRAYVKNRLTIGGQTVQALKEIPCNIDTSSNEAAIAMDAICSAFFPKTTAAADPTRISEEVRSDYYAQIKQVKEMLSVAEKYSNDVQKGKIKDGGDKEAGRKISQILNDMEVAQRRATEGSSNEAAMVESRTEDALMLQYLGRLLSKQVDTIVSAMK